MLRKPVLAGGVALDEGDGAEAGPFKPKVKASDSGKKGEDIQCLNLFLGPEHGQPLADLVHDAHGRVFRNGLTVQRVNTPVVM